MIRIGIAASGKEETSQIAERFARAPFFIIADEEGKILESFANDAPGEEHGAASKAMMALSRRGVSVILVPRLGPNALGFVKQASMTAFSASGLSVLEALDGFRKATLEKIDLL